MRPDAAPPAIRSSALASAARIRHAFFTRQGGVSDGIHGTLNCGYGSNDDRARVMRNRAICADALGVDADALVTAYQVHGIAVIEVDRAWRPDAAPRADAMVTRRPGIALGILTADCAPVLAADPQAGIVGAAHCGWKGAKAGTVRALVDAMARLGADPARMIAAVGPAIGLASYEVGPDFRDAILADDPDAERFFAVEPGRRPHFDLQGFVHARLTRAGVGRVDRIAADTCAEPGRFFSYRRACLTGEADYGRQLSAIALASGV